MKFPYTHKRGSVRVTIYRIHRKANKEKGRSAYTNFAVVYYGADGKIRRDSCPSESAALAHAKKVADDLSAGRTQHAELTAADAASFARAKEIIGRRNLENVASEYMDAVNKLGGASIADAVRLWQSRNPVGQKTKTVADVLDEMLRVKRNEGLSEDWLHDLEIRLGRFAEYWTQPISELTGSIIHDWIGGLKSILPMRAKDNARRYGGAISDRSRNNYRTAIATMVSFAIQRHYLPKEFETELDAVGFESALPGKSVPFSPEEITQLLSTMNKSEYPSVRETVRWVAVRAFAGVRHKEATRMDAARDIHLKEKIIILDREITKTGSSRVIPIQDNLARWLALYDNNGKAPLTRAERPDQTVTKIMKRIGINTRHNPLRDSYVSYRMAAVKDLGIVSQETGHTPEQLQQSYRSVRLPDGRLITEKLAAEYFSIVPTVEKWHNAGAGQEE